MLCAIIHENLVKGVVDLTEEEIQIFGSMYESIVDVSGLIPIPQVGWSFDGATITGTTVSRKITRLAMRQRFTVPELLGIMNYVASNPASIIAMLMQNLQVATFIDLSRSDTQAGLAALVGYGLITSPRATTILTTIPTQQEIYTE